MKQSFPRFFVSLPLVGVVFAALAVFAGLWLWVGAPEKGEISTGKPLPAEESNIVDNLPPAPTPTPGSPVRASAQAHLPFPVPPRAAPSLADLVPDLFNMSFQDGALTAAQAAHINQGIRSLVEHGNAAIPLIQELLARNVDVVYGELKGGHQADYRSLRTGLLDALRQIGGPEAMAASLELLQTTGDPWEVAILARNLEQQAPGEHRDEILRAARESLAQLAQDKSIDRDVAPLFQVLQGFGDVGVIQDLEQHIPNWEYYAMRTLAGLPDGQGVSALVRETENPEQYPSRATLALQLLAQISVEAPEAGAALVEKARANQIPDNAWQLLAATLGGAHLEFGRPLVNNPSAKQPKGSRPWQAPDGKHTLYTLRFTESLFGEQLDRRIGLIDQLLGVNTSPAAVEALHSARSQLAGMKVDYDKLQ